MILTRARGSQALQTSDYQLAIQSVEEGLETIRTFYRQCPQPEAAEHSGEIASLEAWLEELRVQRPLTRRERLERALRDAVNSEDYERAAKVRDELKTLKSTE
jgi:protein-arginine kinase activator protein McsA